MCALHAIQGYQILENLLYNIKVTKTTSSLLRLVCGMYLNILVPNVCSPLYAFTFEEHRF